MTVAIAIALLINPAHASAPTLLGGNEAEIKPLITEEPEAVYKHSEIPVRLPESRLRSLVEQYLWDTDVAYAVMMAESREGDPNAYNPEWHRDCQGSYGLFQIACLHVDNPEKLFNPAYNVQKAYEIWKREGWQPWAAYTNGSYREYLVE